MIAKCGERKNGRRLTEEQINQLLSIGFVFELKEGIASVRFWEGMEMLRSFYEEEGYTDVPMFYSKNPTFGLIAENIRKEFLKICHQPVAIGVTAAPKKSDNVVNASKVENIVIQL